MILQWHKPALNDFKQFPSLFRYDLMCNVSGLVTKMRQDFNDNEVFIQEKEIYHPMFCSLQLVHNNSTGTLLPFPFKQVFFIHFVSFLASSPYETSFISPSGSLSVRPSVYQRRSHLSLHLIF